MTRLSNRQYPMVRDMVDLGDRYLKIEDAQKYDQRPFRSMLIRKWVGYRPGHGFYLTRDGRTAWAEFHNTNIFRADPTQPLTAYFDPTAYGLHVPKKRKRREVAAA